MFKRVLIANRGEIAVRVIQTCRELDIHTIALYTPSDLSSLHVRLADEVAALETADDFLNIDKIIQIATERGADAIHPGIGFLAERADFAARCEAAGIAFIGATSAVMRALENKIEAAEKVKAAGLPVVATSERDFSPEETEAIHTAAQTIGFPLVIKSVRGGRGSGERLVRTEAHLAEAIRQAQVESTNVYGDGRLFLEKAITPAHQVGVQIIADTHGAIVHLGEREGSIIYGNRKVLEESPAPCLNDDQRARLWDAAAQIAKLLNYQGVGTVEFLVDDSGNFYFTELKSRLQTDHPITEMVAQVDLVHEQIKIALGEPLSFTQADVHLRGWAMMARIHAEDPDNHFLPSPGTIDRIRFPLGIGVRIDTYVYGGASVPADYTRLFAKLTIRSNDRATCLQRLERSLRGFIIAGIYTNIPLLLRILQAPEFVEGRYTTDFTRHTPAEINLSDAQLRDLAALAAVLYLRRSAALTPDTPSRLTSGWHRDSRRLPETGG